METEVNKTHAWSYSLSPTEHRPLHHIKNPTWPSQPQELLRAAVRTAPRSQGLENEQHQRFRSSQNPAQLTPETSLPFRDSCTLYSWLIFHQEGGGGWEGALILHSFMLGVGRSTTSSLFYFLDEQEQAGCWAGAGPHRLVLLRADARLSGRDKTCRRRRPPRKALTHLMSTWREASAERQFFL